MVQPKPTPEEQLLKLIENPDAKKASGNPAAGKAPGNKKSGSPFQVFAKIPGFVDYLKTRFQKSGKGTATAVALDIKWVNKALIGVVFMAGFYLLLDMMILKSSRADFLSQVSVSDAVYPIGNGPAAVPKDVVYYKDPLKKRNPFLPPGTQSSAPVLQETTLTTAPGPSTNKIAEVLQGMKLVGISWGAEPLAMLEDSTSGRTYFLKSGQEVRGVKIQSISKEKVVVTYEGEEGELF